MCTTHHDKKYFGFLKFHSNFRIFFHVKNCGTSFDAHVESKKKYFTNVAVKV